MEQEFKKTEKKDFLKKTILVSYILISALISVFNPIGLIALIIAPGLFFLGIGEVLYQFKQIPKEKLT